MEVHCSKKIIKTVNSKTKKWEKDRLDGVTSPWTINIINSILQSISNAKVFSLKSTVHKSLRRCNYRLSLDSYVLIWLSLISSFLKVCVLWVHVFYVWFLLGFFSFKHSLIKLCKYESFLNVRLWWVHAFLVF